MKKTTLLFLTLFIGVTLSAQWAAIYNDPTKIYSDADFPTSQDGFVLGHYNSGNCFILKTTDAGLTWAEYALPAGFFDQIAMYSATSGYVSAPGILLRTTNGFLSTVSHTIDLSFNVMGLELLSDSNGFYMNNDSHFRSFNNYGASYLPVMDSLQNGSYFDVADSSTVYVGNGMHMEKSTDAGASWFCVNNNLPDFAEVINFVNADTGYYLGSNNGIWRTIDGGLSFQNVNSYPGYWMDAKGQYCAAIHGFATVLWSSDYGQTWATESHGMTYCNGVYIAPGGDCYLCNNINGDIRKRQLPLSTTTTSPVVQVSVFPNPTDNMITLKFPSGVKMADARLVLVNTLCETVLESDIPNDGRISLESLAAGIYYYQVISGNILSGTGVISKQ